MEKKVKKLERKIMQCENCKKWSTEVYVVRKLYSTTEMHVCPTCANQPRKLYQGFPRPEKYPKYHLKITIQGGMEAGKTFSSHKIGEILAAYGCHVALAEAGKLTSVHYGQHNGSLRRVLINTSLDPIPENK
jgi:protein-arginine kinase activator protein McsA